MNKYLLMGAAMMWVPAAASAQDIGGPRAEVRLGLETLTLSDDGEFELGDGFAYGAEAGFDLEVATSIVAGPFASYDVSTAENCEADDFCLESDGTLNIGGRFGMGMGGGGLLYAKLNWSRIKLTATTPGDEDSESDTGFGGAIGYEMPINRMAYFKIEASVARYGDELFGIDLNRRHIGVGAGLRF